MLHYKLPIRKKNYKIYKICYVQLKFFSDAPEFIEKPHIIQRDGGKVLVIKVKAKSKTEPKIEWTKNDQPVKESDRVKFVMKKDEKVAEEYVCMLEIKVSSSSIASQILYFSKNE